MKPTRMVKPEDRVVKNVKNDDKIKPIPSRKSMWDQILRK